MSKKRELLKKDWYEILNENLKYANKDLNILNDRKQQIMNEQIKLNEVNLLNSNSEDKPKIKNPTEHRFYFPEENKLISNKLNLRNYKTKNYISNNSETQFLKAILEKMYILTDKKIRKPKYKSNKTDINNLTNFNDNNTSYNKSKYYTSRNNKKEIKYLINDKKDNKNIYAKNNNHLLSKTYNNFNNNNISTTYFPKLKNKKNNLSNKKEIMKMILDEEDNTINKGKSISNNILQLNKDFVKQKRLICGYDDRKEDYIIMNNRKIYQINLEKIINTKFKRNFLNIKKIKDIENGLLNDSNHIFDNTRKNIILKYQQKIKNRQKLLEKNNIK